MLLQLLTTGLRKAFGEFLPMGILNAKQSQFCVPRADTCLPLNLPQDFCW